MHRVAAALVAALAWAGLAVRLGVSYRATGDVLVALWAMARFFTVLTNLVVAVMMTLLAAGRRVSASTQAGVTLAIILVAVIYVLLLRHELTGAAYVANALLHYIVPTAAAMYWLAFGPKVGLRWRSPFIWILYPLAYFAYVLVRGSIEGRYPYPFMNVGALGVERVLLNAVAIAVAFLLAGLGMVAIGRSAGRGRALG